MIHLQDFISYDVPSCFEPQKASEDQWPYWLYLDIIKSFQNDGILTFVIIFVCSIIMELCKKRHAYEWPSVYNRELKRDYIHHHDK